MAVLLLRGGVPFVLIAAMVAGCGSSQPASPAGSPAIDRALVTAVFPDAAYEADGELLHQAEQRLIRRCMAERGEWYPAARPALPPPPSADAPPDRGAGYGLAARFARVESEALRVARTPEQSRHARMLEQMSPRQRARYERLLSGGGRPGQITLPGATGFQYQIGGCAARALTQLYRGADAYYRGVAMRNAVAAAINDRLERDRGLRRAGDGWRRCMADAGHRFRSPNDARQRIHGAYIRARAVASVGPRERATAAADRRCGLRSGFYREQARARRAAVAALSPRHVRWAKAWTRTRAQAVLRARDALAR